MDKEELQRSWILRKVLNQMSTVDSMEFLLDKLSKFKNNKAFLEAMSSNKGD